MIPDAIPYCGPAYWALSAIVMTWLILFGLFTGRSVVLDTATKTEVAYPFVGGTRPFYHNNDIPLSQVMSCGPAEVLSRIR